MPENIHLPAMKDAEHVVQDYATLSLSVKAHPVTFIREKLNLLHCIAASYLLSIEHGAYIKIAGLVLVRQRPGTAKGVCFMTIEDETGYANVVVFPDLFETFRKPILQSKLIIIEGNIQKEGEVIHVILQKAYNASKLLRSLTPANNDNIPVLTLARPDEKSIPAAIAAKDQFPSSRDFK